MQHDKDFLKVFGIIAVVVILIWYGFGSRKEHITQCKVIAKYYVTADFSQTETYPVVSTDANGNTTTKLETSTEYWSEPASAIYRVETVDGDVSLVDGELEGMSGARWGIPKMPRHDIGMRNMYNFDASQYHRERTLYVFTYSNELKDHDQFREPVSKNGTCIDNIQNEVKIKTWFGVSYGSNFL